MRKMLGGWVRFYDWRVWLSTQLIHLSVALAHSPQPASYAGDRLSWYLSEHLLAVFFLAMLYVLRIAVSKRPKSSSGPIPKDTPLQKKGNPPRIDYLFGETFLLDSNIWMKKELEGLFRRIGRVLRSKNQSLTLLGPQFDEICNIKDRAPFASKQGRLARLALARIEEMQRAGCLRIQSLAHQANPDAYADPPILEWIAELTSGGKHVHFVTDDRELRIRAREVVAGNSGSIDILDSKTLWASF